MQTYIPSTCTESSHKRKNTKKKEKAKLLPSEIKKMMREVENNFIKPKPQKELNGDLGVTLFDIAQSLGTSHAELKRRVERSGELEYLKAFGHRTMSTVIVPSSGPKSLSFVLDVMAAQHIVAKYDNFAGRYYLDFLIRCKDAFKISLESHEKIRTELDDMSKKLEVFTRPKLTRKNNVVIRNVVAEKSDLFHDTTYRVERQTIKQPSKGDSKYDEHYIQKLTKISKGNAKSIQNALLRKQCDLDVLNFKVNQLTEVSNEVDTLINPEDKSQYKELVKKIELERLSS